MPYIRRAGANIYYSVEGGGKTPVLFIHGYMGSIERHWSVQIRDSVFQEKFLLVAMDSRGFNRSTIPGFNRVDIADVLLDIVCLLDKLAIKRTAIAGYSLGGYVALEFAKNFPARVSCLVLVSAQPFSVRKSAVHWSLISTFVSRLRLAKLFNRQGNANQGFKQLKQEIWSLIKAYWRSWGRKYFKKVIKYPHMIQRLQEIRTPVLVVQGDNDTVIDGSAYEILKTNLQNAQCHLLKGADHGITRDHPGILNPLMIDFLEKNGY
ncbi:MAG: alpha/beta fold hydrolase [Candidatus Odinarchaeota archaeon]